MSAGVSSVEAAAIWLDHISCNEPVEYCKGFLFLDDIQV